MQPTLAQMRMALGNRSNVNIQNIGASEAPSMSPKSFVSPDAGDGQTPPVGGVNMSNGIPVGGIDMSQQQAGQQMLPQSMMQPQGGLPQQGQPQGPQGPQGAPLGAPAGAPPMGNMLSMTPQGQALGAMSGPPQPPKAMRKGGSTSSDDVGYLENTPKKPNPLVGKRFIATPQGNLADRRQFEIMKHEGKGSILSAPYDSTTRDNLVTNVSGHDLDTPLLTEAGFDYSLDKKNMKENRGGASNLGIAQRVQKRIDQTATENDGNVFLLPSTMSDSDEVKKYPENFSHHPAHIILDLLKQNHLNKKTVDTLSDDLRNQFELEKNKNDEVIKTYPYKNFLGYHHPKMMEQVMKGGHGLEATAGDLRKKIIERLGQVNIQKLLDYNLGDVRAAILDPDLVTDPKGYMGHTVVKVKSKAELRPSSHSSYDTDYFGKNVGGMKNRPLELLMPDTYSRISKELLDRPKKTVKSEGQHRAQVIGALEKRKEGFSQPINARVINNAGLYEEGLQNGEFDPKNIDSVLSYFKRKGGYKKGGNVHKRSVVVHTKPDTMKYEMIMRKKVK